MNTDRYLFRGKRKDTGDWACGDLIQLDEQTCIADKGDWATEFSKGTIELKCSEVIPETIGQFTGLTDKNGVKIFEGDIYKHPSATEPEHLGFCVLFMNCSFVSVNVFNHDEAILSDYCKNCEVIGNIHSTPSL